MSSLDTNSWRTPRARELSPRRIADRRGLTIDVLPNGALFAIEHRDDLGAILVNQLLASPIDGGIARIVLRVGGQRPQNIEVMGPRAGVRVSASDERFLWEGETAGLHHRVTLRLLSETRGWLWRVEAKNAGEAAVSVDAILMQDLGLGSRAFVTNNEAYASQYIDHHIAAHTRCGHVVMSRQNLAQEGRHPWAMHGCLEGAAAFATDAMQLFGPRHRDADGFGIAFGTPLAAVRLQHEAACVAIQSRPARLEPGASASWRFFALYDPDHAKASDDGDLARLDDIAWPDGESLALLTTMPRRSYVQDARAHDVLPLTEKSFERRYADRYLEEADNGRLLSFFVREPSHNRHVVLREKERIVTRRHGVLLRSGKAMLPDESTLCATCWMHGVFAAQLTIGNTSFHKLFSVSRDPYNIVRSSGLRILVDAGEGWRLLTVPSAFDMGLSDCRWIYALTDREIDVRAIASGDDPAMQWRISIDGAPCRLLVFGHVVLGERELDDGNSVNIDAARRRITFKPDPASLWGGRYPNAVYHLVTTTPHAIEAIGGDELLFADGLPRAGTHVAIRTQPTRDFCFAVVGSLTDPANAARLASKYAQPHDDEELLSPARQFWTSVTRGLRIDGEDAESAALDASLAWLAHDAMIHLTVPHGLEQYTGAAWGTRDVCQGPVEFLLALEHDQPVREILRIVFAQQYAARGDWPQWFMLEPYASIQDRHSHGDVIVWPLKALNDYVEATGDLAFLDEAVPWRDDETLERTVQRDSVTVHVEKLLATAQARFVPGTYLIRYGEGDWNDSLQPADPALRDVMVSSWTIALLYQQLVRYAEILRRVGRAESAKALSDLALAMRADFDRFLVRDETVAGYGLFEPGRAEPELLLHPSDVRTGLRYSLIPMTRSILAGLFSPERAQHHLGLIREHLLYPDGARLIDRPVPYRGGLERTFRRAESAAFFGREIGLMYVHAYLRYAEAMAVLGERDAMWEALRVANPILVTDHVAHARLRQRNTYFSSSDAAFADRYLASVEWQRLGTGDVSVEGGWRTYSSGPGMYVNMLVRHALGRQRLFGERIDDRQRPTRI